MKYTDVIDGNCGIYMIKNTINNKKYIGQSHNIHIRWQQHKAALRNNRSSNRHLQFAWNKYGESAFEFIILEICSVNTLDMKEEYWISFYDTTNYGYNIQAGGLSNRGWKMSPEGRKKISHALKGKKKSTETCKRLSESKKEYFKTHLQSTSHMLVCLNTGETFDNAMKAHMKYPSADISAIHECCKSRHSSCGKGTNGEHLVWRYIEDYQKMTVDEINECLKNVGHYLISKRQSKAVICITTNLKFSSCKEAANYYNMSVCNLCDCLKGRQKTAGKHPENGEPLYWAYCG